MQTPKIYSGRGCLNQFGEQLQRPAVLFSDRGLGDLGVVQRVADLLGIEEHHAFLEGEPTAGEIDRAAELLRGRQVTVVGLGGGSALDLTKLAASVAGGDAAADTYAAMATPLPPSYPTVLIPTTAGTGSEMTRTAVFADSRGRKTWAWGEELQAHSAVLDPELTLDLPQTATVLTAVDALSHALEAGTVINQNSLTRHLSQKAVAMIPSALAQVMKNPRDLGGREELLNASALAGIALNSCGTGLAHALAHGMGSLIKVSHGLAIAYSLRVTLEWNPKECYQQYPWLAGDPPGVLGAWLDSLPIPPLPEFDVEQLAEALLLPENVPMLNNNARPVTAGEVHEVSGRLARR